MLLYRRYSSNAQWHVVFLWANDDQVQIHGIRLELNEIENTLRDIEGVMDVAVVYNENLLVGNFVVKKE